MRKSEVKRTVQRKIHENVYEDIENFIKNSEVTFWGIDQPPSFKKDMLLLTLYKDLFGVGYHALVDEICFNFKITDHSLRHNVSKMRPLLNKWAEGKILPGNLHE
jgi:hypothetical protein